MQPGANHEGKEPDDLERHRLPTRVRSRDDQHPNHFIQLNIVGDDLILCEQQERMPGLLENDTARLIQAHWVTFQPTTHLGPGLDDITLS